MDEFPGPRAEARPLVLIPAYKPEGALRVLVEQLCSRPEIAGVVVVDDGDGPEFRAIFDAVALLPRVHRLAHVVNLGKGSALKTGLNYVGCEFPGSVGVVTADADGQHAAEDILRVAKALMESPRSLILGVRGFDANVPFRSKFGNTLNFVAYGFERFAANGDVTTTRIFSIAILFGVGQKDIFSVF